MKTWENVKDNIQSLNQEEKTEIEIISDLVASIIKRREELGLSQRDLAEISGVKQPAIARLETLGSIPRLDTLIKIVRALGLKINLSFDEEVATA